MHFVCPGPFLFLELHKKKIDFHRREEISTEKKRSLQRKEPQKSQLDAKGLQTRCLDNVREFIKKTGSVDHRAAA